MSRKLIPFLLSLIVTACSSRVEPSPTSNPSFEHTAEIHPTDLRTPTSTSSGEEAFARARAELVRTGIIGYGIIDEAVIEVMGRVERHDFVPEDLRDLAYANRAIPIGYGQTISQPFIVALMTQELEVSAGDRILEIGTGSGYQAAILDELGAEVFTIEIVAPLAEEARQRYRSLGYTEIRTRHADGYYGWEEYSPFDRIIVTAAPDHVPPPLLQQLKIGGILVIPVGPVGGYQELWKITKTGEDSFVSESLGGVIFVPFTRLEDEPAQ